MKAWLYCPACGLKMTAARKEYGICFVCEELKIAKPTKPTRPQSPPPPLLTIAQIKQVMNLVAEQSGVPVPFDDSGKRIPRAW